MKNNNCTKLFSLGNLFVSDFIKPNSSPAKGLAELSLVMENDTKAVRLTSTVDPNLMYGEYWYRSGINTTMNNELKDIAEDCVKSVTVDDGDIWVDIACNDGTMFKYIPSNIKKVGIDPADDTYANESSQHADLIIQDFFSAAVYNDSKFRGKKAKVVTAIAMFYDVEKPLDFLKNVEQILDDEGLFVMQMSYTPLMIKQLAFDNICHEHVYYYTLGSLKNFVGKANLEIVDCKLNDINGGSFRIYMRKVGADKAKFRTAPYRDVADFRVQSILKYEIHEGFDTAAPYLRFFDEICSLKDETMSFIRSERQKGKKIWGYGASTKGNTLLQWYGLDDTLIDAIAERNPSKFGLRTVGTNIPIKSEDDMREENPDYLLVLPWHFISEFSKREKQYLDAGGKFIVPCPKFEIIGR